MKMFKLFGLLALLLFAVESRAQGLELPQDETFLASVEIEVENEAQKSTLLIENSITPPTAKQIEEMTALGWLPLQEVIIEGAISCAWADGLGGELNCPPGATGCAVNFTGNGGEVQLVCVNAALDVLDSGLERNLW